MLQIEFENDYQKKIMRQTIKAGTVFDSPSTVTEWRNLWMAQLSSWHSPYKALIDCQGVSIKNTAEIRDAFDVMFRFFKGFFLKKAVGLSSEESDGIEVLPFEVFGTMEEAEKAIGIRVRKIDAENVDFRGAISIQNHFRQHVMELSFVNPVLLEKEDEVAVLKDKISNNLMLWHSKWNLLVDCSNLEIDEKIFPAFEKMLRFFSGFFLKDTLGYSPMNKEVKYPFKVYRSRHNAAGRLESEGNFSGEEANCQSRK